MITDFTRKHNMLPPGSRVLCALSGGSDSMCLVHLLKSREEELGIKVFAAHYEHGLRGEESLRDCAFVENWCRENGIECAVAHGDAAAFSREKGMSVEEGARHLRYAFLEEAAERLGCDRIATAHNADDNAETMVFNLSRGSGSAGLCGIPPVRGNIIRPLLGCSRSSIEAYLEEKGLPHVEDSSNLSDDYSRNLIRHRVTPVLRQINPALSENLSRTAELLRRDEDYIDQSVRAFIRKEFDGESIDAKKLAALHPAVSGRVIRLLCPESLSFLHVEAAIELSKGSGLAFLDLPGIRLCRDGGRIYFGRREESSGGIEYLIPIGIVTEIPEMGIAVRASEWIFDREINNQFKTYLFKYESICGNITCTSRRSGDRLRPAGRGCNKSLKSLFLEAGLSVAQRDKTPVFRDEKGIIAVHGIAVEQRCAAAKGDKVIKIDIEKI